MTREQAIYALTKKLNRIRTGTVTTCYACSCGRGVASNGECVECCLDALSESERAEWRRKFEEANSDKENAHG
jgi:hypothetical protein